MKSLVLYGSLSGNTKKVATAIAQELYTDIIDLQTVDIAVNESFWQKNPADLYFLGTGIYASHVVSIVRNFLIKNHPPKQSIFALYATGLGLANSGQFTLENLKAFLTKNDVFVLDPPFLCFGKTLIAKTDHPNDADLINAREWAQGMVRRWTLFKGQK